MAATTNMNDSVRKSSRKKQKPREYWRNDVFSDNGAEDRSPPRKDALGAEVAPFVTTPHQRQIKANGVTIPWKRKSIQTMAARPAMGDITNAAANCVRAKRKPPATDATERRSSRKKYKTTEYWRNEERETEILPGDIAEDTSTKPHRFLFAIGYRHGAKVARVRAAKKSFAANRALVEGVHATPLQGVPATPPEAVPATPLEGVPATPLEAVPATPLEAVPECLLEDIPLNETLIDEVATIETPHQPHIEKGKWGGWRPGLGRPRRVLEPGTPIRRRYKPGEPRPPRGRPSQRDPKDITQVVKRIRYKAGEPRPKRGRPKKTQMRQLAV